MGFFCLFSHFHNDHTRGVQFHSFNSRKKVICHPEVLEKLPQEESLLLQRDFELLTSQNPTEFVPNIIFLGEIPRKTTFEKGGLYDDKLRDDLALALKTEKGVIVISGCSHAGICNICEHAKQGDSSSPLCSYRRISFI